MQAELGSGIEGSDTNFEKAQIPLKNFFCSTRFVVGPSFRAPSLHVSIPLLRSQHAKGISITIQKGGSIPSRPPHLPRPNHKGKGPSPSPDPSADSASELDDDDDDEEEDDEQASSAEDSEADSASGSGSDDEAAPKKDAPDEAEEEDEKKVATIAEDGKKVTFADLGVIPQIVEACTNMGFKHPTPIQVKAIPEAIQARDVIGLAQTGSGKTAAFTIPILQALWDNPNPSSPTIVGGMDMMSQSIALSKRPHVIVATPGRLQDHLENTKGFSLRGLQYLVMDEADRLLDMDFGPIIDKLLQSIPPSLDPSPPSRIPAIPLHGQLSQQARLGALNKFKTGGYIHRVGRTARAGRSGRSVTLVTQYDVELLQRIEAVIGLKMEEFPGGNDKEAVMLLSERVAEAHRAAVRELKDKGVGGAGGSGKRKRKMDGRHGDDMDRDDDQVQSGMPVSGNGRHQNQNRKKGRR
ncbi:related to DEAD box protein (putative RNA helicase) [Ustilago trichophora]|uniref:Related to DEAD box protein (Putative RNA helicase) n=1 Tax=Ustilago trichophora TaxID=86804 RepID=A0A5C3E609_9BASI|nr:related to DEAD box protein (putative RNA helicase) [Ustilago trichophora]